MASNLELSISHDNQIRLNCFKVTSSDAETKDDVNESKWNRLRARLHEVTGRVKLRSTSRRNSSRYGSLLKLASEERRIHRSRHFSSQPHLNPAEVSASYVSLSAIIDFSSHSCCMTGWRGQSVGRDSPVGGSSGST